MSIIAIDNYFNIKFFGYQQCPPLHRIGPSMRSYTIIHYVLKGKGRFVIEGKEYCLSAGQGFLMPANILTLYEADETDPWEYTWVAFEGHTCDKYFEQFMLTEKHPVLTSDFDYTRTIFSDIAKCIDLPQGVQEMRVSGLVALFFSQMLMQTLPLTKTKTSGEGYVGKALTYIENNYWRRITLEELARHVNIDRTYMCKLFKEHMGVPPNQYLLRLKMERAAGFLRDTNLKVADVARSVGYNDLFTFSKAFKRVMGYSPSMQKKKEAFNAQLV